MILASLLPVVQFVPAFLVLDLFFRYMNVEPAGLSRRVAQYGARYAMAALVSGLIGAWGQWRLGQWWGLLPAVLNGVPWWILWRFGLRKQLTFLFKDDAGQPAEMEKPDL